MARTIWKGHISFGLVQIPVGLYPATDDRELQLHMIDRRDHSPIGYKRVNKRTGEEVTSDDIVKAVEHEEGEWVILTDEDFAAANVEATQTIDIMAFVDANAIEPRYFVKPYYVAPTKKSNKAYALLREVMRRTGKVGIAKVVLRTRQYVAALLVHDEMLVLELLRYAHEVRGFDEFELPGDDLKKLGVTDRELDMAEKLVSGLAEPWDPTAYRDEYTEDLQRMIEEKARTGQVTARREVAEEGGAEIVDIMSLLKRSLEATEQERARKPAPRGTAPKATSQAGKSYRPGPEAAAAPEVPKRAGKAADAAGKSPAAAGKAAGGKRKRA